jgi:hypothetical protein
MFEERGESMSETVTMADVLYVPVNEQGEPYRWGTEEEVTVSVFGDFWRARRDSQSKDRAIRALAPEELRGVLDGRWSDMTHLAYHPGADAYVIPKHEALLEREA